MSTSQKHREYAGEPMREKDDDELAGIGPVLSSRLKQQGFTKAYKVLDQFLFLGKNQEMFSTWLKGTTKSNAQQAKVLCMP